MYEKYHRSWYLMILSQRDLEDSQSKLDQIEEELVKTTISMKSDITGTGGFSDKMASLIAKKVDLEDIIKAQRTLYNTRKKRMKKDLRKLKVSDDVMDVIYRRKFVDKEKVKNIARGVNFSREYTYDLISKIRSKINEIQDELRTKNKK